MDAGIVIVAFLIVAQVVTTLEAQHKAQFGFVTPEREITGEAVEVEGGEAASSPAAMARAGDMRMIVPDATCQVFSNGEWHQAGVMKRKDFAPGASVSGPRARLRST